MLISLIKALLSIDDNTNGKTSTVPFHHKLISTRSAGIIDSLDVLFIIMNQYHEEQNQQNGCSLYAASSELLRVILHCLLQSSSSDVSSLKHVHYQNSWLVLIFDFLKNKSTKLLVDTCNKIAQQLVLKGFVSAQFLLDFIESGKRDEEATFPKLIISTLQRASSLPRPFNETSRVLSNLTLHPSNIPEYYDFVSLLLNRSLDLNSDLELFFPVLINSILGENTSSERVSRNGDTVPLLCSKMNLLQECILKFGMKLCNWMDQIMAWTLDICTKEVIALQAYSKWIAVLLNIWTPLLIPYYEPILLKCATGSLSEEKDTHEIGKLLIKNAAQRHWIPLLCDKILLFSINTSSDQHSALYYLELFVYGCSVNPKMSGRQLLGQFYSIIDQMFHKLLFAQISHKEETIDCIFRLMVALCLRAPKGIQDTNGDIVTAFCHSILNLLFSQGSPSSDLAIQCIEAWMQAFPDGSMDTISFVKYLPRYVEMIMAKNIDWDSKDERTTIINTNAISSSTNGARIKRTLTWFLAHCKPGILMHNSEDMTVDYLIMICIDGFLERGGSMQVGTWLEAIVKKIIKLGEQGEEKIRYIHKTLLDSKACRSLNAKVRVSFVSALCGLYQGLAMHNGKSDTGDKVGTDLLTSLLHDAVPFISELMEDDSDSVEKQCRRLVLKLEEILGDDVKSILH